MLATSDTTLPLPVPRLRGAVERLLRPAVGFSHPSDVLKDPLLDQAEKRQILSSWASDASAVENRPTLRWMVGTDAPVPLVDVLEALWRLEPADPAPGQPRPRRMS